MIQVNLLPSKKQSKSRPSKATVIGPASPSGASSGPGAMGALLTFVILVAALGVSGYAGWKVYKEHKDKMDAEISIKSQVRTLEREVADLEKKVEHLAALEEILNSEIQVLNNLSPPDRVVWAEKLNQLAAMRPPNIYIQTIAVTEEVREVETEASIAATREWEDSGKRQARPPRVMRPIMQQKLRIEAIAYTRDALDRQGLMMRFHNQMIDFEQPRPGESGAIPFMMGMQTPINIPLYRDELVDGVAVGSFVFEISGKQREG